MVRGARYRGLFHAGEGRYADIAREMLDERLGDAAVEWAQVPGEASASVLATASAFAVLGVDE